MNKDWGLPLELVKDVININAAGGVFETLKDDAPIRLLYGTAGSGKTCWAVNFCMGGDGYSFISVVDLIDQMVGCKSSGEVKALERKAQRVQWLILDEIGLEGNTKFNKYGTEFNSLDIIRRILMARLVANKITIMTTNMAPETLFAKYDKVNDASGRVYSRFSNHARIYFMEGDRRQSGKDDQVVACREKQYLDEDFMLDAVDEDGNKTKKLIPLGDRKRRTISLYDESDKVYDEPAGDVTEADADSCIVWAKKIPHLRKPTVSWLKLLVAKKYPWAQAKLDGLEKALKEQKAGEKRGKGKKKGGK